MKLVINKQPFLKPTVLKLGLAAAVLISLQSGCATPEKKSAEAEIVTTKTFSSSDAAYAEWASVLRKHVNTRGNIDFYDLYRDQQELKNFVAWVGKNSPANNAELSRSVNSKVTYHLNAYNALAMYSVLEADLPTDFSSFFDRYRFFSRRPIIVGGTATTLRDFENKTIREFNDERVHFALHCIVKGCARLPRGPFTAARIGSELEGAASLFINDPKNVYIDDEAETVFVSELFKFYKQDFLARAPTLESYINLYRNSPLPTGYKLKFRDFDWRLNYARN